MRARALAWGLAAATLGVSGLARANGLEIPANGTEPLGRGDAWVARATDPIATFYNPAALSRNGSGVSLNVNLIWEKNCFDRRGPGNSAVTVGVSDQAYGRVCNSNSGTPFPDPQLAIQYRVSDEVGVGLALLGPSAYGSVTYPDTATNYSLDPGSYGQPVPGPAGSRYILRSANNLLVWPTLGVGYQPIPNLRIGAAFIWGVASLKFSTMAIGTTGGGQTVDPKTGALNEAATSDAAATIKAHDYFVPGFTASVLYTLADSVDLTAWYHWSDSIRGSGDATISAFAYNAKLQPYGAPIENHVPSVTVTAPQPMEAKIGVRFFKLRSDAVVRRDSNPLRDEIFDVEIDGVWAHDSQFDNIGVHFGGAPTVSASSAPGDAVPPITLSPNATTPHMWKDSFGVRLGSDVNVVPDVLAIRGGAWFQSSSFQKQYVFTDFVPATRVGLSLGATYRVGPIDIQGGYSHVFYVPVDNGGNGALLSVSGIAPTYRTQYATNGGQLSAAANIASIGGVYRF